MTSARYDARVLHGNKVSDLLVRIEFQMRST
ncbi:hypothetical protein FHU30_000444 [Actinomadura rupiterrae]|nr:hypothetical protein [Actinomadura rupiterrae]